MTASEFMHDEIPDEDFFIALEVERTRALVERDVATIRRLHTSDYELISVPGRVMSLERYLALMAEDVFYATWDHGPMKVQIAAGMAAVRYRARITFPSGKVVHCWHTVSVRFEPLETSGSRSRRLGVHVTSRWTPNDEDNGYC